MVYYDRTKHINYNNNQKVQPIKETNNLTNSKTTHKTFTGGAYKTVDLANIKEQKIKNSNIYINNKISDDKLKKFVDLKLN